MIIEGIYASSVLSSEQYHGDKDSISRTAMMAFKESPYRYWAKYINPDRPPANVTPAMLFGSAFHSVVLEPHLFYDQYVVEPTLDKLPKVGLLRDLGRPEYERQKYERDVVSTQNKTLTEEFEASSEGKIIISADDRLKLSEMHGALMAHSQARELIEGAIYEQSYFWRDEHSGLMVKSRPDILHENIIVDLKTMANVAPHVYQREMIAGGYHIQGAIVRDAIRELENRDISTVINVCIEKTYPYSIAIYIIDEFALDAGHAEYKQILLDMKSAKESNEYEDYKPQIIGLPKWAL